MGLGIVGIIIAIIVAIVLFRIIKFGLKIIFFFLILVVISLSVCYFFLKPDINDITKGIYQIDKQSTTIQVE